MEGSAHYEGRAVDVFFRPISDETTPARAGRWRTTWSPTPTRLHIEHVIFDGRIWTAGPTRSDGWHDYHPPELTGNESAATLAILEHRDHVHVDVFD